MNIKLTSKERMFLVKILNKTNQDSLIDKPMGITNKMHVDVLLAKLRGLK